MDEIRAKVLALIADVSPALKIGPVDHATSLIELGLDSLDHATVLLQIEEAFGLKIPDEETERLVTLDSLVCYLAKRVAAKA